MYCLDTSAIIKIFDGKEEIKKFLEKIQFSEISITPITLCELYKGAVHSKVTSRRLEFIERMMQQVTLLDFNEFSCKLFGEDYLNLKNNGKLISDNDLMLAAICKSHNKTLITSDNDFDRVQGLIVQKI